MHVEQLFTNIFQSVCVSACVVYYGEAEGG
jgi:hypothetical protein